MKKIIKWVAISFAVIMVISIFISVITAIFVGFGKDSEKGEFYYNLAIEKIDKKELDSVQYFIDKSKDFYSYSRPDNVAELEEQMIKFNDSTYIKNILIDMSDDDYKLLIGNVFSNEYLNQKTLNEMFNNKLLDFAHQRSKLIEENRLEAERKEQTKRAKLVESQFTYGRHIGLEIFIKDNMNDPKSFEHIETRYRDEGNYIFVSKKFRGKNAFGGKVINTVTAKVGFNDNVIEIISQN